MQLLKNILFHEFPDRHHRTEIQLAVDHILVARLLDDLRPSCLTALPVPACQIHFGATSGQIDGVRLADARVGASDDDHLAIHSLVAFEFTPLNQPSIHSSSNI